MPNWCMNTLAVSGSAEEVKRFVESNMGLPAQYPQTHEHVGSIPQTEDTTPFFCFNALIPTPESVLQMGYDAHDKITNDALMLVLAGKTFEPIDGYHWNLANWGTKWDIYYDKITPDDMGWFEGCDSITFDFDSAWSPPRAWFETVTAMFPSLYCELHYEEPGCYFAGDLIYEDGQCSDVEYDAQQCEETFAYLLDDETEECGEEDVSVSIETGWTK